MISVYDTLNIAFYFAFIVGVGFYFARRNRDSSDYFRGGGMMPWWVTGASSWLPVEFRHSVPTIGWLKEWNL